MGLANHTVLRQTDGTLTPIDDSAAPIRDDSGDLIGVVLVFRDITNDRKDRARAPQYREAGRRGAPVGDGRARDQQPARGCGQSDLLARTDPALPPDVVEQLTQAEQELERVAHITRQTLGFFRDKNAPGPCEAGGADRLRHCESIRTSWSARKSPFTGTSEKCPPIRGVRE